MLLPISAAYPSPYLMSTAPQPAPQLLPPAWADAARQHHWLVGHSGGRDSTALCHALLAAGFKKLTICHINHQLRGDEAQQDALFVEQWATAHALPYVTRSIDIPAIAQTEKKGFELVAREQRQSAFASYCQSLGCQGVLLAHHADDQAETMLYNLLRGAAGLRGMHMESCIGPLLIVRPLLDVLRRHIDAYIEAHQLNYREDPTNAQPITPRNRIRHELLPLADTILKRRTSEPLQRALRHQQAVDAYLKEQLDFPSLLDPQGRIFLPKLRALHPVLQSMAIHTFLQHHAIAELSQTLIERCLTLLTDKAVAKINLPQGRHLRRQHQRLFVPPPEK